MGKATIQSSNDDGSYTIEIEYDRTQIDAMISKLNDSITKLNTIIADCENKKAALQGEIDAMPESKERQDKVNELLSINIQIQIAKLQIVSAEKRIEFLQDSSKVPQNEDMLAWCADYTTDLTGSVGTVEVGREKVNGVNIQPGYEDNAVYNSARDGQLTPAMALSPAGMFVNLALLPGAQMWKPMYRYGTITAIDYEKNTCNVALDTIVSSQQNLLINQDSTLADVPVQYMECDALAFEISDEVLIQFTDQDFTTPKVIGFKEAPKPCCWVEPFDGPELTTKWPWDHDYVSEGWNQPHDLPDNSTVTISNGVLSLSYTSTPLNQYWFEQYHQWFYYPPEAVINECSWVKFDAVASVPYGTGGVFRQYMLALIGEKDGDPIYFNIFVVNNYFEPYIGVEGLERGETDWVVKYGNTWSKNIPNNKTEFFQLPVENVKINYVVIQMDSFWDGGLDPNIPTYIDGGAMQVNHIELCKKERV